MRSRYVAYVDRDEAYLLATWDAETRPPAVRVAGPSWVSLQVHEVTDGSIDDEQGIVSFTATFEEGGGRRVLHERSRFRHRRGRWYYVDAIDSGVG